MLSLARPLLLSILLAASNMVYATRGASVSVNVTAYARAAGDLAAWQMCNLAPGITVTFTHNPARAGVDRRGVLAGRTRLDMHVSPRVKPGAYHLIFISYSFVDGPHGGAIAFGYHPTLRVLANHAIRLPAFNRWFWIHDPEPQDIAPPSTCTLLPAIAAWSAPTGHTGLTHL